MTSTLPDIDFLKAKNEALDGFQLGRDIYAQYDPTTAAYQCVETPDIQASASGYLHLSNFKVDTRASLPKRTLVSKPSDHDMFICRGVKLGEAVRFDATSGSIIIGPDCSISYNVYIGSGVVPGKDLIIGNWSSILGNTEIKERGVIGLGLVLAKNVCIGECANIAERLSLEKNVILGKKSVIHSNVHIFENVCLGNNVNIGAEALIGPGTNIGSQGTIGDDVGIWKHVSIGDDF